MTVVSLEAVVMILDLHLQRLTVSEIARQCGLDRKTVRRYIKRGLEPPTYGPRKLRQAVLDPFKAYLRERVGTYPGLTGARLLRELRELGYSGGYTARTDFLRDVRPRSAPGFEVHFETAPGEQGQVDFEQFQVMFAGRADDTAHCLAVLHGARLQSPDLGPVRQALGSADRAAMSRRSLRCFRRCYAGAVLRPHENRGDPRRRARRYRLEPGAEQSRPALRIHPKAWQPYRAKTKGKVERPFRYIREDFFLARSFRNLVDLNDQLRRWLDGVANPRMHATTRRVVNEAFAEERLHLRPLPLAPFRSVLRLERRISRDGMISVGGNFCNGPDATRRRLVEVHTLPTEVLIFEDDVLIPCHPMLEGRHQRRVAPGHRNATAQARRRPGGGAMLPGRAGDLVAPRTLEFYDAVGRQLARRGS